MGGKSVSLIHRVVDFPQGYFFRLAFQSGAAVRTPQRQDESRFVKFDQKPPNHNGICINRLGQTRRGTAIVLLQCQDRHHMHRKSKSTAGHAMNVTNLITFSKGYQRGRETRSSIVLVIVLVLVVSYSSSSSPSVQLGTGQIAWVLNG